MFLLVKNNQSNIEELDLVDIEGIKIYNLNKQNEIQENGLISTKNGDVYKKDFEFKDPTTLKSYFSLTDEVDSVIEEFLKNTAQIFGISIKEINSYEMIKEISEVTLNIISKYFNIKADLNNPEYYFNKDMEKKTF